MIRYQIDEWMCSLLVTYDDAKGHVVWGMSSFCDAPKWDLNKMVCNSWPKLLLNMFIFDSLVLKVYIHIQLYAFWLMNDVYVRYFYWLRVRKSHKKHINLMIRLSDLRRHEYIIVWAWRECTVYEYGKILTCLWNKGRQVRWTWTLIILDWSK